MWESNELYQRLKAAAETADEFIAKGQGGALVLNTGLAESIARQWFEEQKAASDE
jgi:hypothetical protein